MFKFGASLLLAMSLLLGPLSVMAADLKIGVVDTGAILAGSAEGRRIQDAIKKKAEELSRPLGSKRQDIGRQLEEFEKQASMMKEDARKRKGEELQKKMQEFDKQAADADKQLAQYRESQLSPMTKKMDQALEAVAREEKLDLVLDKSVVLISNKAMDMTDKVRSKFGQ